MHSPTTTRTIAIDRIATAIPLCPLDAGDNVEHARTRGEKRLANAADKRAHDEIRVRLEGLLVSALMAIELFGLFRKALGVQLWEGEALLCIFVAGRLGFLNVNLIVSRCAHGKHVLTYEEQHGGCHQWQI